MLVVLFPDRDDERAGVTRTMFMNEALLYRPTSGATADDLVAQLREARDCTRRLTDDLTVKQLIAPARGKAMSLCPAGAGSSVRRRPMVSFSTTRSGRTRSKSHRSASPKPPSATPSSPRS